MEKNSFTFLMPHDGINTAGGYKVVYQYANRLCRDGFNVTIVYPNIKKWNHDNSWINWLRDAARFIVRWCNNGYRSRWFDLDSRIRLKWVWSLDCYKYKPDERVIATAVETAYYLNDYHLPTYQKFYFIQDYENWFFSDEFVRKSYAFPMRKIVIATWLQDIVCSEGEMADLVINGFDFSSFKLISPIDKRNKTEVACMYHIDKRKDFSMAFEAFAIVKNVIPDLHVSLFSIYDAPDGLPEWYSFTQCPDRDTLNLLYNSAAIFVGSSKAEGWGLPVGEAMICGCAVACTDNKGYLEMAKNDVTALVSPVGNSQALADNIIYLIKNDVIRHRIAYQGNEFIQDFEIGRSYEKFKKCLIA